MRRPVPGGALLLDDDPRRLPLRLAGDLLPDALGELTIDLGMLAVGLRDDDRGAGVGSFADGDVERHFREELDPELFRLAPCAAMTEDLAAVAAIGAREIAHVLDDTEHRHIDLAEHVQA